MGNVSDEKIRAALIQTKKTMDRLNYNTISQIEGFLETDDPTFLSSRDNVRNIMRKSEEMKLSNFCYAAFMRKKIKEQFQI